jgi:hypothetical protein
LIGGGSRLRVLIACEFSGIVRDAFAAKRHYAVSCDLLPTEKPGAHLQMHIWDAVTFDDWDMMIAHPPCTYLCNSGVSWLHKDKERWDKLRMARDFFMGLYSLDIKKICVENPIPHKYALLPKYSQIIHPWQFGHGETKATCLWLKGLPKLEPTNIVDGREQRIHKLPPSKDRGKLRSITYQGIADAMAEQWG